MKIIYLSIVLSFFIQTGNAQLGYFGKKNAIKFDGYFIPAYRAADINSIYELKGLATTANLNLSRIISQKTVLSLEYNYFKDYLTSSDDYGSLLVKYIRQNGIGLSLRRFRKSWIAPIGSYWMYSIMFCKNDVSEQKKFDQLASWTIVKYGIGYGYQKVIYDKILLDFGAMIYFDTSSLYINNNDPRIGYSAPDAARARELLRLKIGIGYLL